MIKSSAIFDKVYVRNTGLAYSRIAGLASGIQDLRILGLVLCTL
jgi:lipoprotein signal peptidase